MDKLSNHVSNCNFDEDIFDDSSFMEKLDSCDFKETNEDDMKTDLNISALCCDEELKGYDKLTGETWIYPTNYPVRDYQFNIIKAAMLKNCLVSLPTGLGKTFIAAVVMYNFYRWYPLGKIIFTAPTRPLVAQQIEACYNIVAMPPKDTIEMTGQMQVNNRKVHWQTKRVFFATPQVIYNDIKSGICPGDKIRCLVFDEAHKARGNYAYGNIISTLSEMQHKLYRVLALSATPGNKVEDVIHVVKRLHISHLELRTDNCPDVKVYSHARQINTVVVALGPELTSLRQQYVEILDGYNRKLKNFNIVQNLGNLSKGRIVMLYKEFQSRERGARHPQHSYIMRTFTLLITLYHGLELLIKHGARVFLNFFDEHPEKTWIQFDKDLTSFFEKLRNQIGVNPLSFDRNVLPDGTIPEIPSNLNFGHPKFDKLKEIMLEHFNKSKENGQDTKAIVFCEYRESVNLVHCLLLQCRPTIVPEMFVGQSTGKEGTTVSQKQQVRVMRRFRGGLCNTLVCTCVAEEGLDVGAVDLILCFDVSTRSPIRLVQRCGRTGRERSGQVFILVTEGREHTTLLDCMRQNDGLNKRILQSEEVKKNLYKSNPRMLPRNFMPECQKMYITVKKELNEKPQKSREKSKDKLKEKLPKGQQDLRSMFQNKASSSKTSKQDTNNEWITKEEFHKVFPRGYRECNFFSKPAEYWTMSKESVSKSNKEEPLINMSSHLNLQKQLQDTYSIGHSSDTTLLTELLRNKHEDPIIKSPVKKDGDIRVLFSKTTKSIKNYTKSMKELGVNYNLNISTEVLNLLVDISLENTAVVKRCYICHTVCNCTNFSKRTLDNSQRPVGLYSRSQPVLPDIDLIDNINPESLVMLANENDNNQINNNATNNKSLLDSRDSLKYSGNVPNSSKVKNVEMIQKLVDCNKEQDIQIKTANQNLYDNDCLFEEDDVLGNIDMLCNLTPNKYRSKTHLDNLLSSKTINESTMSDLKNNNKNNTNIEQQANTVIIDREDDIIFEDSDFFEDDMPFNLTQTASKLPKSPTDGVHTIQTTNSNIQGKIKNASEKANIDLENDTIIIDSQEIRENDNIFVASDGFDGIDMPVKPKNPDDIDTIKGIPSSVMHNGTAGNNNNNSNIVLDNEVTIIESHEMFEKSVDVNHTKFRPLSGNVHGIKTFSEPLSQNTRTLSENNNEIIELDSDVEDIGNERINETDDIFEDDDIFDVIDNIETQNNETCTKSKLQLNDTKQSSESTLQKLEDENDIYTESVLKYFRLHTISDIFQDSDVNVDRINEKNVPQLVQREMKFNEKRNNNNEINAIPVRSSSPSLLTGRSISDRATSPILMTQKRKINLSINKRKSDIKNSSSQINSPIIHQEKITKLHHTDPDYRKIMKEQQQDSNKIIILDSDDDSFEDDPKDCKPQIDINKHKNTVIKRKYQEESNPRSESPYFRKKLKLNENCAKPSTMKEKIMAALTSHQNPGNSFHSNTQINYVMTKSPTLKLKKENRDPLNSNVINKKVSECNIDMLEIFRYGNNNESRAVLREREMNVSRKIMFNDDDDFKTDMTFKKQVLSKSNERKKRKEAKKVNEFLDFEAELSQEGSASADERSDSSEGSMVDFICDEAPDEDIHDVYLQSVKSPVKGVFKMPQLPPLNKAEVFSQYVEEDTYEMDSFCIDSHVILNETTEMSELELAEMILKEKRKNKKSRNLSKTQKNGEDSPIIKKNSRNIKRQIHSDSEDSS